MRDQTHYRIKQTNKTCIIYVISTLQVDTTKNNESQHTMNFLIGLWMILMPALAVKNEDSVKKNPYPSLSNTSVAKKLWELLFRELEKGKTETLETTAAVAQYKANIQKILVHRMQHKIEEHSKNMEVEYNNLIEVLNKGQSMKNLYDCIKNLKVKMIEESSLEVRAEKVIQFVSLYPSLQDVKQSTDLIDPMIAAFKENDQTPSY